MLISHTHKFIFFAVPKTATHAVREVLRERAGDGQWEQQVLRGEQFLPIPELAAIKHGHITVQQAQQYLPSEIWNHYRKFAVVRNPYERFISACAFLNRRSDIFTKAPVAWMKQALQRPKFRERVLIRPQADQLCNESGLLAMDYLARYESLEQSLNQVFSSLGIDTAVFPHRNASKHNAWHSYYDAELKRQVGDLYQRDLDCFNYSFN